MIASLFTGYYIVEVCVPELESLYYKGLQKNDWLLSLIKDFAGKTDIKSLETKEVLIETYEYCSGEPILWSKKYNPETKVSVALEAAISYPRLDKPFTLPNYQQTVCNKNDD